MGFSVNDTLNGTAEDAMSLAMSYTMYKIGKYHFCQINFFAKHIYGHFRHIPTLVLNFKMTRYQFHVILILVSEK